ncbi:MAG TPA: PEGA domain-containing protein [Vicinamibacterales bacterium]|nr:PEGA domain-containing protein [Vicinamibacterales bacterium]
MSADAPLDDFPSEFHVPRRSAAVVIKWPVQHRAQLAAALLGVAILGGSVAYAVRSAPASRGSVRIESEPGNASIVVDGHAQGATPVTLDLPVGRHSLTLVSGTRQRTLSIDAQANTRIVHHIELPEPPLPRQEPQPTSAVAAKTGPASAKAPVQKRTTEEGPTAGWLRVATPLPFTITENGDVVGTTESSRVLMPAGEHTLGFRSSSLGFTTTQRVRIEAGRVTSVALKLPQAPMQINALPWADVWIDGQRVGETPLSNVMQTIGPHEIVFRHPQFGERRMTAVVTLNTPARASVDMKAPQ